MNRLPLSHKWERGLGGEGFRIPNLGFGRYVVGPDVGIGQISHVLAPL